MRSVCVLGGTFNPIHFGHIQMAVCAHEQFDIRNIAVMPSGQPSSYKDMSEVASAEDRCAMVRLAIKDYQYMSLSTLEIDRKGTTYTSDTLRCLKKSFDKIYFLIGADSLYALEKWHKPEYVMANCCILAAGRDNRSADDMKEKSEYLKVRYHADIQLLDMPDIPYSSSDIRERIRCGKDVTGMLPDEVIRYINTHRLYL